MIIEDYMKKHNKPFGLPSKVDVLAAMNETPIPFVLTNDVDENWGFLSTSIGTRTTKWINMVMAFYQHNCSDIL
jgi:hypothetical protein